MTVAGFAFQACSYNHSDIANLKAFLRAARRRIFDHVYRLVAAALKLFTRP